MPTWLLHRYPGGKWGELIRSGGAGLVNVIACRSPQLSREPENRRIAKRLPSLAANRKWLREEGLPAAAEGKRRVLAHRPFWWDLPRYIDSISLFVQRGRISEEYLCTGRSDHIAGGKDG